jgi:hypothetical protein
MALGGCNIIFTTSFGFMDATNAVAAKFPDVKFEHATGYKRDHANVSTYNARFYEGRAVQGHIAGKMTKSNKIGYIASFPIPEVIMGINSYYLHAKKVNPNVELSVVWAFTWFDPAKEADAAKALIDQGVDVIASHTDSTAPLAEAAKTNGAVIGFGQASDMAAYKPSPRVSSIIDNWAPYYIKRVGALLGRLLRAGRRLGRDRRRRGRDRRDHRRCPGRREGRGRGDARRDRRRDLPPLHRPDQQAGRQPLAGRRRDGSGRRSSGDELLRRRHHRRHPAVIFLTGAQSPQRQN